MSAKPRKNRDNTNRIIPLVVGSSKLTLLVCLQVVPTRSAGRLLWVFVICGGDKEVLVIHLNTLTSIQSENYEPNDLDDLRILEKINFNENGNSKTCTVVSEYEFIPMQWLMKAPAYGIH